MPADLSLSTRPRVHGYACTPPERKASAFARTLEHLARPCPLLWSSASVWALHPSISTPLQELRGAYRQAVRSSPSRSTTTSSSPPSKPCSDLWKNLCLESRCDHGINLVQHLWLALGVEVVAEETAKAIKRGVAGQTRICLQRQGKPLKIHACLSTFQSRPSTRNSFAGSAQTALWSHAWKKATLMSCIASCLRLPFDANLDRTSFSAPIVLRKKVAKSGLSFVPRIPRIGRTRPSQPRAPA